MVNSVHAIPPRQATDNRLFGFGKPQPEPQKLPPTPIGLMELESFVPPKEAASKAGKKPEPILYLPNATDSELSTIFSNNPQWLWEHKPMWVVFHRPEWASLFHPQDMMEAFPMYMMQNRAEWVCGHHPKIMMAFNPDILKVHNPSWMITHHPHLCCYLYPEIVLAQDPEIMMAYRPELFPKKMSWWQIFVMSFVKIKLHKAKTQGIEVPAKYLTQKENS